MMFYCRKTMFLVGEKMKQSVIKKPFRYTFNNAALIIIAVNIGVFMLTQMSPELKSYLSLNVILVLEGNMYFEFFTYMFTHSNFYHLLGNMLGVFFFGVAVERSIGSKEFVLMYVLIGFLCGLVSFIAYYFSGMYYAFLLGASGSVYAILLVYAVLFPNSKIFIWGILPISAPLLVLIYAGITVWNQLFSAGSGIAHLAHLAGFVFAWIYLKVRMGINPWNVWKDLFR